MGTLNRARACFAGATLLLASAWLRQLGAEPVDMAAAKKRRQARLVHLGAGRDRRRRSANLFRGEDRHQGRAVPLRRLQHLCAGSSRRPTAARSSSTCSPIPSPRPPRMMTREGLFVPFKAADFDKVPDEVKDPDGYHVAQRLNVMAMYRARRQGCRRRPAQDLDRPHGSPNTRARW